MKAERALELAVNLGWRWLRRLVVLGQESWEVGIKHYVVGLGLAANEDEMAGPPGRVETAGAEWRESGPVVVRVGSLDAEQIGDEGDGGGLGGARRADVCEGADGASEGDEGANLVQGGVAGVLHSLQPALRSPDGPQASGGGEPEDGGLDDQEIWVALLCDVRAGTSCEGGAATSLEERSLARYLFRGLPCVVVLLNPSTS